MTNFEIWKYFNLTFNNVTSNVGAGITRKEATEFINRTKDAWVDSMYSSYEKSEYARKALVDLVKHVDIDKTFDSKQHIVPESKFYELPSDLLYIVYESVTIDNNASKCFKGKIQMVVPVTHDDFHHVYNDPFKYSDNKSLRVDSRVLEVSNSSTSTTYARCSEIVCKANTDKDNHIGSYHVRYIRKPSDINLDNTSPNYDDNAKYEDIPERFQKEIIESAAKLCAAYYKS